MIRALLAIVVSGVAYYGMSVYIYIIANTNACALVENCETKMGYVFFHSRQPSLQCIIFDSFMCLTDILQFCCPDTLQVG